MDSGLTASGSPPSPIMASVGAVAMPPAARAGMVGILKPRVCPPTSGTQSGMVTEMLLIFSSTQLMAEITPLIGALARFTIMPNRFPKMFTILSQAPSQFPVKTFFTNSMIFVKMSFTFSTAACMLCHHPVIKADSIGKLAWNAATRLEMVVVTQFLIFPNTCAI